LSEYLKGDFDGAISDATHAIQLDPKDGHAYGTRGWARYGKGDLAGALEDCKKAVELFSKDPVSSAYDQGMVDFINGENQKAIDSWQSAIQRAASLKRELQPWIEKAKAREGASHSEGQSAPEQPADGQKRASGFTPTENASTDVELITEGKQRDPAWLEQSKMTPLNLKTNGDPTTTGNPPGQSKP
jgi:tetratricopeptide (TPR) repeat protein